GGRLCGCRMAVSRRRAGRRSVVPGGVHRARAGGLPGGAGPCESLSNGPCRTSASGRRGLRRRRKPALVETIRRRTAVVRSPAGQIPAACRRGAVAAASWAFAVLAEEVFRNDRGADFSRQGNEIARRDRRGALLGRL